jgi:hypothetical protein
VHTVGMRTRGLAAVVFGLEITVKSWSGFLPLSLSVGNYVLPMSNQIIFVLFCELITVGSGTIILSTCCNVKINVFSCKDFIF